MTHIVYMVQSIINPEVTYPERKLIDKQDKDHDSQLYAIDILGVCVHIALGKPKLDFADKGMMYFPIYLTENERLVRSPQIGVYEVSQERANKTIEEGGILDEDGDVDLNEVGEPLLYSFVPDMLGKLNKAKIDDGECTGEESEDKPEIPPEEIDITPSEAEDVEVDNTRAELPIQSKAVAEQDQESYDKSNTSGKSTWINVFLENPYFAIEDNEGGGDCLFAAIRDGLAKEGVTESVEEMRQKLAAEANQSVYEGYKEHYDMFKQMLDDSSSEISRLGKLNREMKNRIRKITDAEERKQFLEKATSIEGEWKAAKAMKEEAKQSITEVAFMKDINSLDAFKEALQKCSFWGDTWAISTLEKALNVKLVLLSEEAFDDGDLANVLQCGQLNDNELSNRDEGFNPDWYIMLSYNGIHYQIITYRRYGAFKFDTLPYQIKELIAKRCMETANGPYYIIPEIRDFMESEGMAIARDIRETAPKEEDRPESWPGLEEAIAASKVTGTGDELEPLEEVEVIPEGDESSVEKIDVPPPSIEPKPECQFMFSSTAGDRPYPGKGPGEKCPTQFAKQYATLRSEYPNWRKKLSDEYSHPISLQGKTWQSVSHYTLANKYRDDNPDFYMQFALESRSDLSKNAEMAKGASSKTGKYKKSLLRPSDVVEDKSYSIDKSKTLRKEALDKKFGDSDMARLLKMTSGATLLRAQSGAPPVEDIQLMSVRDSINQKNIV